MVKEQQLELFHELFIRRHPERSEGSRENRNRFFALLRMTNVQIAMELAIGG